MARLRMMLQKVDSVNFKIDLEIRKIKACHVNLLRNWGERKHSLDALLLDAHQSEHLAEQVSRVH